MSARAAIDRRQRAARAGTSAWPARRPWRWRRSSPGAPRRRAGRSSSASSSPLGDAVADREQLARRVEEEAEVHLGRHARRAGRAPSGDARACGAAPAARSRDGGGSGPACAARGGRRRSASPAVAPGLEHRAARSPAASPGGSRRRRAHGSSVSRSRAWLATLRAIASAQATHLVAAGVAALRGQRARDVGQACRASVSASARRAAQSAGASARRRAPRRAHRAPRRAPCATR